MEQSVLVVSDRFEYFFILPIGYLPATWPGRSLGLTYFEQYQLITLEEIAIDIEVYNYVIFVV